MCFDLFRFADDTEAMQIVQWLDNTSRLGDFFRVALIKELIKVYPPVQIYLTFVLTQCRDDTSGETGRGKGESFLARLTSLDDVHIPPPLAIELHTLYPFAPRSRP